MTTATLTKWGNGQGVLIPKGICEQLGVRAGDRLSVEARNGLIELRPEVPSFRRTRVLTAEEVFAGWEGEYEPPADWPASGKEIGWGGPVGKEVW